MLKAEGNDITKAYTTKIANEMVRSLEAYLAMLLFLESNKIKYGKMVQNSKNEFMWGESKYPDNLKAVYIYLVNYKNKCNNLTEVMEKVAT